jgi:hypothetical protein
MKINGVMQILVVSIIFVLGCNRNAPLEKSIDSLLINIKEIQDNVIDTTILSEVQYIPLEISEKSVIGNIDKILYHDKFYVLDKRNQAVHIFENDGAFFSKIQNAGRGPGDYQYLMDFDIDSSGNVYIYDHQLGQVLKYDINGMHMETFNAISDAELMAVYDSTCIIFNQVTLDNNKICQLVSFDLLKREKTILLEGRDVFDTDHRVPDFSSQRIMKYKRNLYYTPPFSNLIYRIEPNKVTIACEIIPSEFFMDKETLRSVLNNKLSFNDHSMIYQIRNYFETENYINIWFRYDDQFFNVFYSKKSNKFVYTDNYNYKLGFPLSNIIGATVNGYIGVIDPMLLYRMNSDNSSRLPKELQGKGLDSNPVLIHYTLKPF